MAVNSLTSIADGLERKGLLRRIRSDADRRVVHVELTEAGLEVSRSVMEFKSKFHRELLAALTEEEQAILLVLLRKVGGIKNAESTSAVAGDKNLQMNGHAAEPSASPNGTARRRTSPARKK